MTAYRLNLGTKLGDMHPSLQNFWKRDFPNMYNFAYNLDALEKLYRVKIIWDYKSVEFPDRETYMQFVLEWS